MVEFQEQVEAIQEKVKKKNLIINRIPMNTRNEFINFAKEEFCDDYGMALKHVWDNFKMGKVYFENIEMKLDTLLERENNQPEYNQPEQEESITTLSGKKIQKGGKS